MERAVLAVLAALQGPWVTSPLHPTVGDTIWLSREVATPAGWRVRPGKLEPSDQVEPLAEPTVSQSPAGWVIRYAVVAWAPGRHEVAFPPVWRQALDGKTDSVPGGVAAIDIQGVIPDSVARPEPKAALGPLRPGRTDPLYPLAATLTALAVGVAVLVWRRRPHRADGPASQVPLEPEVPDRRWLAAGEPKAVAARAAGRLRAAIARAEPAASTALSTPECLALLERRNPRAPLRQLAQVLEQLDRIAFASAHGSDVTALSAQARTLERELAP